MSLSYALYLGAAVFALGTYGVMTRRNAIGILLSVELMANAVNILLAGFSRYYVDANAQVFALFVMALTVAEVAVALALVILLYRAVNHSDVDRAQQLRH